MEDPVNEKSVMEDSVHEDSVMGESVNVEKMFQIIREMHVDYLKCDNVLLREKYYRELRDGILLYLSQENLNFKFTRAEFADLLKYNIENKPDVSLNGMCQAFEALEIYANNLLLFPWRNEYRQIKMYGGFFKHKVTRFIDGVEEIFKLMGYKYFGDFTLVLWGPLNRDKLIEVALNCLIASCECTLILEFHQLAVGSGWQSGYEEVYKLRNTYNDKSKNSPYDFAVDQPPSFYIRGHKFKDSRSGRRETLYPEEVHEQVTNPNYRTLDGETTKKSSSSTDKTQELLIPETHDRHIEASISALNLNDLSSINKLSQPAETGAITRTHVGNGYNKYDVASKQKLPVEEDLDHDMALRRQHKLEENSYRQYDGEILGNRSNYFYPSYNEQPQSLNNMLMPYQSHPNYYGIYPDYVIPLNSIIGPPYGPLLHGVSDPHVDGNGRMEPRTFQRTSVYEKVSSEYADERGSDQATPLNSSKYMDDLIEPKLHQASRFNREGEKLSDLSSDTSKSQTFETDINVGKSKWQSATGKTPIEVKNREYRREESNERRSRRNSGSKSSDLSIDENQWECSSCTVLNKPGDKICKICSRSKAKVPDPIPLKSRGKECANCTYINEANRMYCSVCLKWLPWDN